MKKSILSLFLLFLFFNSQAQIVLDNWIKEEVIDQFGDKTGRFNNVFYTQGVLYGQNFESEVLISITIKSSALSKQTTFSFQMDKEIKISSLLYFRFNGNYIAESLKDNFDIKLPDSTIKRYSFWSEDNEGKTMDAFEGIIYQDSRSELRRNEKILLSARDFYETLNKTDFLKVSLISKEEYFTGIRFIIKKLDN